MEFNREQIVKALECCEAHGNCRECPLKDSGVQGCIFKVMHDALTLIKELTEDNKMLRKQLKPFKEKQCFTCSFNGVGYDHMPCHACRDYDKYKWLGDTD
jgi:hypothetical protein